MTMIAEEDLGEYRRFKKYLGEKVKKIRKSKKMSQEDTAGIEVVTRTYIGLEHGKVGPNLQSIFFICKNLGTHPSELFKDLPFPLPIKKRK